MKSYVSSFSAVIALCAISNVAAKPEKRLLTSGGSMTYPEPDGPLPPKQMYKELIYMEKMCENWQFTPINNSLPIITTDPLDYEVGDYASFNCELYEAAVVFKTYGGVKVGDTYWGCQVVAFEELPDLDFTRRSNEPIWDCTIYDYVGRATGTNDALRNEGVNFFLYDPTDMGSSRFETFRSHEGIFATIGGISNAKGARGQLEVEWDMFKMTWIHIYTVEVWNLEQKPILADYPVYQPHK